MALFNIFYYMKLLNRNETVMKSKLVVILILHFLDVGSDMAVLVQAWG
jgi:hypothetical protein